MNNKEKRDLWNPVRDKYFHSNRFLYYQANKVMAEFFHTSELDRWRNGESLPMEPELRRKLEALLGPFGDALFKAMRIKRDAEGGFTTMEAGDEL